jgi:large conductance mechanosensitive channel
MSSFVKEFKDFINRGNVVDLAVAVVLGAAFGAVVTSFVDDILMQIVAAIIGKPDFSSLTVGLGDSTIYWGAFVTVLINFIVIAFAVFLVVKAINEMQNRRGDDEDDEVAPTDVELLSEIRDLLAAQQGGTPPPTV